MIREGSSSNSSSWVGSNAISHAYIQYPPLRCRIPGSRSLFYDDGNKLILSLTSNQVFSWNGTPYNPYLSPSSDLINEGPVLSIRYSLDLKLLAIQRSIHEIQIWNKETGDTFSQKCRSQSESILGFFWTDSPTSDIVFVKTSGLDLYSYNTESRSLQLVETKKSNISWYIYSHESRLVLLASGMHCRSFTGYQLSSAGTIPLPKFEMSITKSEANNKPILAAEDVHIITVYGRIYCLQYDRVAMLLHLYRFYRDAVVQQGSLPVYSNSIAVSVIDNVLLVHQVDAKVVIIYDIFADSLAPISAPLPLLLRGFPTANFASSQTTYKISGDSAAADLSDITEFTIYGDQWNFFSPDLVCDTSSGFLWKISMDLEVISASSSEGPSILEFLQRRKVEAEKAKRLCLESVRTIILERKPVQMVSKAIDILVATYSTAIKTGSYYKRITPEAGASRITSAVVNESTAGVSDNASDNRLKNPTNSHDPDPSTRTQRQYSSEAAISSGEGQSQIAGPDNDSGSGQHQLQVTSSAAASLADLYTDVFAPVEEEMPGDGPYLTAIFVEFLRSASLEGLKVHPGTYVLMVQILARDERYADLGLFIINKIIEPSREVALQLVEAGRHHLQMRKLGLSMLRQLSLHHDYVLLLVQDGHYLEALRYARKNKVNTVEPSLFLEAARASEDPQHLAAVVRFLCGFIPGFRQTADYQTYHSIFVGEMNSAVGATA